MFTGIVQGIATVKSVLRKPGLLTVSLEFPSGALKGVELGASISIDGTCLTVTGIDGDTVSFDIIAESLERTNLSELEAGMKVNFERSLKFGDELGGHLLSGHIDGVVTIASIERPENNFVITFNAPKEWMKYLFPKGYVALNGASLTLATVDKERGTFSVSLIPETLRLTTFAAKTTGAKVNLEIERQTQVMVDTVNDFLLSKLSKAKIEGGKLLLD